MNELIVPPVLSKILNEICEQKNVNDYKVLSIAGNAKGEGFLGEISFVALRCTKTQEIHNLVIKLAISDDTARSTFPIRESFLNEIYFYNDVWKKLDKFQIDRKVRNKFDGISKLLGSSTEDETEYLALENLKTSGFEVFPKSGVFDAQHLELICKEYGRFHALSFAYRTLHPEEVEELGKPFVTVMDTFVGLELFQVLLKYVSKVAAENFILGEDDHLIHKLEKYINNAPDILLKYSKYKGEKGIFIHGDCWSNNLMFKYNEARKLTNLKLIDLQLVRLSSPVHDLSYCLYSAGSPEFYNNFDKYLHIYHNSYTAFMKELNCDPNIYTFEDLKSEWKEYSTYGFVLALSLTQTKLTKSEDVYDLKDSKDSGLIENIDDTVKYDKETFLKRVKDLIVHREAIGCL